MSEVASGHQQSWHSSLHQLLTVFPGERGSALPWYPCLSPNRSFPSAHCSPSPAFPLLGSQVSLHLSSQSPTPSPEGWGEGQRGGGSGSRRWGDSQQLPPRSQRDKRDMDISAPPPKKMPLLLTPK